MKTSFFKIMTQRFAIGLSMALMLLSYAFPQITLTQVAQAATGVPETVSYQGRLTDSSGQLLGGAGTNYYFKFSIWDDPTVGNGSKVWPAGAPGTTTANVSQGVFNVNIGDTANGYPDALDFDFQSNDTVYLQVEVSPNVGGPFETLSPRQQISSSGYAINAGSVQGRTPGTGANNILALDGAGDINIGGNIVTSGNLQGASGNVTGNLDVGGVIQAGSGNVSITLADGSLNASALGLITGGGAGSTSSGSGLEVVSNQLGLLQGCADNNILKWNDSLGVWACAVDASGVSSISLQNAYDTGNSITTTDSKDVDIVLADTAADSNLDIDLIADNTVSISRNNGASTEAPSQLLLLENLDTDLTIAAGVLFNVATGGALTTAIDASDSDIVTAVAIGNNDVTVGGATISSAEFAALDNGISLTSEVTGILPAANGGTGVDTSAAGNGTLLIGTGSGLTLATLTQGSGITITNGSGSITIASTLGTSVDLTSEVAGVLPVANGGTGASSLNDLITLGTHTVGNYVATITGNSQIAVSGSGSENAGVGLSINNDSIGASQLASTLTFADGDLIDLSSINTSSTSEGLKLPQATSCTSGTAEGQICWDTDGDFLSVGTGSGVATLLSAGSSLFTAAASSGSNSTISQGGTLTIAAGSGITTTGNGSGTITIASTLGTSIDLTSEVTGILPVANGGTGASSLNDLITLGTHTTGNYVATIAGSSQISVSGSGSENAAVTLGIVADSIGDAQLAFNTGQNLTTASSPTFAALTVNGSITLANSETISNGTNGTITLGRNDAGTVTITAADNDSTAALTILPGGAAALTLGGASTTAITLTTDSTGDGEVVLPNNSIGNSELVNSSITVNTTSPLGGGGAVSLGGSLTLTCATCVLSGGTLFTAAGTSGSSQTISQGDTLTIAAGSGITTTGGATDTITIASTLGTSIDLTSEVVGILPVANGGTGATSLANLIALGTDTTGNYVATIAGSSQVSVSGSGSETAAVTLGIVADSIGDTQLAFNTGQDLTTADSPEFTGLTLSGLGGGGPQCLQVDNSGVIGVTGDSCGTSTGISSLQLAATSGSTQTLNDGDTITIAAGSGITTTAGATDTVTIAATLGTSVDLTSEVTGVLPVANGGTGTGTAFTAGSVVFAGASGTYIQDNANFFWDDTNNRLGIGTNTVSDTLTVGGTVDVSGHVAIGNLSSNADKFVLNIYENMSSGFSDGDDVISIANRITVTPPSDQTNTSVYGISTEAEADGAFDLRNITGAYIEAQNLGTSDLTSILGTDVEVYLDGGTVTNAYGSYIYVENNGTATNTYGLYIDDVTSGTQTNQAYSLYQADSDALNYFAGNVGIGDDTPVALLTVGSSDAFQVDNSGVITSASLVSGGTQCLQANSSGVISGTGSACGTATGILFTAAGTSGSSQTISAGDTLTIAAGAGITTTGGATDTITIASTLGTSVDLTSEVTGILPVANGGTGASSLADLIVLGTDTTSNYVATIAGSSQISVSGSGSESAAVTLGIVADSIGDTQLAFNTGQDLTTTSDVEFAYLNLSDPIGFGQIELDPTGSLEVWPTDSGNQTFLVANGIDYANSALEVDTEDGYYSGGLTSLWGYNLDTESDGAVATADVYFYLSKNDANARTFSGVSIKPELDAGASNANTTLNVLSIDTYNDSTIGLTTNLIKAAYGGTQQFLVDSSGVITSASLVSGGTQCLQANSSGVISGTGSACGTATGTLFTAAGTSGTPQTISAGDTLTIAAGAGITTTAGATDTITIASTLGTSVDLTSEVTGTLPVGNGGTGATTLNDLITLGTHTTGNYVATISGNTQVGVSGSGSETAAVSLSINTDSITASQLNATLTFADGDLIDLSSINTSGTGEGLKLPQATSCASGTAEGQICWDTDGDFLSLGTGSGVVTLLGSTSSLFTAAGTSGSSQTISAGDTLTIAAGAGITTTAGATDTITIASTLGTSVDLTSEVTGILPLANGGSNKNFTASAGSIVYSDSDSFEASAVGTTGQALISGGTGAPTWFAPTAGSVLFAGTSGILQQDNANFFWDDSTNSLGIGDNTPTEGTLTVGGTADISGHVALGADADVDSGQLLYPAQSFSNILNLQETFTDLSADNVQGITNYIVLDPSSTPTAWGYGIDNEIVTDAGNAENIGGLYAAYFAAKNQGTGTIGALIGIDVAINNTSSGDIGDAIAGQFQASNGGTGTIDETNGIWIKRPTNFGTINRNYGLYVSDQSGIAAGDSFNIYSNGASSLNYFGGSVGIGSTSPESLLEVQATEGNDAVLTLDADDGDDNADTWFLKSVASNNNFTWTNHTTEVASLSSSGALQLDSLISGGTECLQANSSGVISKTGSACGTAVGTLFTAAGTSGTPQTISAGDTLTIAAGSGITTTAGATDTITIAATLGTSVDLTSEVTGILPLANGGTGANLVDPNADRIFFWDDSAGSTAFLDLGTGLSITGTTLNYTETGDVSAVGDCSTGACFTGSSGTTLTFDDPDGDKTFLYDTTNNRFQVNAPFAFLDNGYTHLFAADFNEFNINGDFVGEDFDVTLENNGDSSSGTIFTVQVSEPTTTSIQIRTLGSDFGSSGQIQFNSGFNDTVFSIRNSAGGTGSDLRLFSDNGKAYIFGDQGITLDSTITATTLATGGSAQCLQANSSGVISLTGSGCGSSTGISTLTLAGTSGTPQSIVDGDTITIAAGSGITTTAGATDTITIASTLGTSVDLTSEVTGILPLANGGTNKNITASNGAIVYSDADSFELLAGGTSGRALISGGSSAPTWFAPTAGSVLFAGTSGILQQDNAGLFYDDSTNRLGIGDNTPTHTLDVSYTDSTTSGTIATYLLSTSTNGTGTRDFTVALEADAVHNGAGDVTDVIGISGYAENAGAGDVANAYGYYGYAAANTGAGVIDNAYGIYLETQTAGTNNYNIWSGLSSLTDVASLLDQNNPQVFVGNNTSTAVNTNSTLSWLNVASGSTKGGSAVFGYVTTENTSALTQGVGAFDGEIFINSDGDLQSTSGFYTYTEKAGSGTVGSAYGVYIDAPTVSDGSITEVNGLYIADTAGIGTSSSYNIYSDGLNSTNYFAGYVGIGDDNTPTSNLEVKKSDAGNLVNIEAFNSDNTNSASNAAIDVTVGGSSGGDPFLALSINTLRDWIVGVDNSDSDKFKIDNTWGVGSSTVLTIDTAGNVGIGDTSPAALLTVGSSDAFQVNGSGVITSSSLAGSGTRCLQTNNSGVISIAGAGCLVSGGTLFTAAATSGSNSTISQGGTLTVAAGSGITTTGNGSGTITIASTLGTSVDLTSEVVGILPVANGGTGAGSLANLIALGTDTTGNYVATIAGSSQVSVSGSGSESAAVTLGIVADSIGDSQLAFNTGQDLTISSDVTFANVDVYDGAGDISIDPSNGLRIYTANSGNEVFSIANNINDGVPVLKVDTEAGSNSGGLISIWGYELDTEADGAISAVDVGFALDKDDSNTRVFSGVNIKPTLDAGASNANTTLNILSIDTDNASVTGLTTNLIKASYGGTQQFLVSSAGVITSASLVSGGTQCLQANSSGVISGTGSACGTATGTLFTAAGTSGSSQTISAGDTLTIAAGSGITTTAGATDTITIASTLGTSVDLTSEVTGILPLANGGTGANLSDPNADRIFFWDDSAGSTAFLDLGTGLSITGTTLSYTETGDISAVGDCSTGACFTGSSGTTLTFDDPDGDQTFAYDTTNNEFDLSDDFNIAANQLRGTTAVIDFTDFDVDGDGKVTLAPDTAGDAITITNGNGGIQALVVDASTVDYTTGDGIIDITVDTSTNLAVGAVRLVLTDPADGDSSSIFGDYYALIVDSDGSGSDNITGSEIDINNNDGDSEATGFITSVTGIGSLTGFSAIIHTQDDSDDSDTSFGLGILLDNGSGDAGDLVFGIDVTNFDFVGADEPIDALVHLDNADDAAGTVPDAILIESSGVNGGVVDAIDASASNITNALNIGANNIIGTTGVIDFTNFDVAASGQITLTGVTTDITTGSGEDLTLVANGAGVISLNDSVTVANTLTLSSITGSTQCLQVNSSGVVSGSGAACGVSGTLFTAAGTSGTPQTISSGDTLTIAAGSGITTTAGATDTITIASTLGTSVDLTSEVTGILPLANGGTNKNITASNGSIVYSDSDSFELLAGGTSGRALISGGSSAPTWFAPTAGSVLFAGTSGILQQDNAGLFYDDSTNRLGLGDSSPDYTLEISDSTNTPTVVLSDDDVNQPFTSVLQADGFLSLSSISTTAGGAGLIGVSDTDATGFIISGGIGSTNPTDTTPAVLINGVKSDGSTGPADLGASETVLQIANNDNTPGFTILGNNNVGIGDTSPAALLTVGSSDAFQVNGSGVITSSSLAGSGTRCLQTNNSGVISIAGAGCLVSGGTLFTAAATSGSNSTISQGGTLTVAAGSGITTTGNGSGTITIASTLGTSVDLTSEVTGVLPVANGGTGTSTAFTTGSVVFAGASGTYTQDNANFFWDDSNNWLGIGTNTPGTTLEVNSANKLTDSFGNLNVVGSDGSEAINKGGQITLSGAYNGGGIANFGTIAARKENATAANGASYLAFGTISDDGGLTNTEKVRISSSGNVGIGDTTPTEAKLTVAGTGDFSGHVAIGNEGAVDGGTLSDGDPNIVLDLEETMTNPQDFDVSYGINNVIVVDPSADASTAAVIGINSQVESESSNSQDISFLSGGSLRGSHRGSGELFSGRGAFAGFDNAGAGTVETAQGLVAYVDNNGSGLISDARGITTSTAYNDGGGDIDTSYGIYIEAGDNSEGDEYNAAIGLYIQNQSGFGATESYNIVSEGSGSINYFEGSVGIGDDSPAALLTVGSSDAFQVNGSGVITSASLAGAGTQCLQADNSGVISGTGSACGAGGGMTSFTLAGSSGSSQTITDGNTLTIAAGAGITTTGGATDTITIASTLGTSVDLTSEVTGVLPLANGGTNKNLTAANGSIVYSDADSFELLAGGTSGRALISGGSSAPSWFAPTAGSVLFAGTSGILQQDNAGLFYDDSTNRLGIGDASPDGTLELSDSTNTPNLIFSDDDVSQPATSFVGADVFGSLSSISTTAGGLSIGGISDDGSTGLALSGMLGSADPTDTVPAVVIQGYKSDGSTSIASLGDSETVLQIMNVTNPLVTVLGNGNVGIGVVDPDSLLDVYGADNTVYASSGVTSAPDGGRGVEIINDSDTDGALSYLYLTSSNADTDWNRAYIGAVSTASSETPQVVFGQRTSGGYAERMRINENGYLGIGATGPTEKLEVAGNTKLTSGSDYILASPSASGEPTIQLFNSGHLDAHIVADDNGYISVDADTHILGNAVVGTGSTSGTGILTVTGTGTSAGLLHLRSTSGEDDYLTFTEDSVDNRGAIGFDAGSGSLNFVTGGHPGTGTTKLSISSAGTLTASSLAGAGTQCLQADNSGVISGTGSACGSGGSSFTAAGSSGTPQTISAGDTLTIAAGAGITTTAGATDTITIASTLGTSVDLASEITGVLPLANGGSNKNITVTQGGILWTDSDSFEVSAAGTTGQALISGGTGAPTWYAPTAGSVLFAGTSGILQQDNSNYFWDDSNNFLGLGINSSLKSRLNVVGTTTASGADAIAGTYSSLTLTNSTSSGSQFGNRTLVSVNGSVAGSEIGEFIRVTDNTSLSNTVRGIEVQAYSGTNNSGINTGIAAFGKTFGVQAETTAQAGSVVQAAAVFADLNNSSDGSLGNAIRAFSDDATSATLVNFTQNTSTFTGTGLSMNFAASSGSFTGNFLDLQKNGTSKLVVDDTGELLINIADADNAPAIYINTEESTNTQTVWALESDTTNNGQSADTVKAHFNADGSLYVSFTGTGTANAVCHTGSGSANNDQLVDCTSTPAADYAEMYPVAGGVDVGEVVMLGQNSVNTYDQTNGVVDWTKVKGTIKQLVRADQPYNGGIIGVVSDNYGDFISTGYNIKPEDNPKSIALNGRVPVRVNLDNGAIRPGDWLTASRTPGVAMRANKPGTAIGQALAAYDGTQADNLIMVFVHTTYYDPTTLVEDDGSIVLQRGAATTTLLANSGNAAFLVNQSGIGDLLSLQSSGADRFLIKNNGAININTVSVDDKDQIAVIKSNDEDVFTVSARGEVAIKGNIIVRDDSFAGSIATKQDGTAEISFTYDLGTGKPSVQLTPESETPVFAQIKEWKTDSLGRYTGFTIETFGLGGTPTPAIVHYLVVGKEADYDTVGTVIQVVNAPQEGAGNSEQGTDDDANLLTGDGGTVAGDSTSTNALPPADILDGGSSSGTDSTSTSALPEPGI